MSREEKRKIDRLEQWFDKLSPDKKQLILTIIDNKINSNNNAMSYVSDVCTVGALDDILDLNIDEIDEIITKIKNYLIEYGEFLEKEKDEGFNMINNEEIRNNVKIKIKKYIDGKIDKARGLKLLRNEFNLPFAELSDLWIECKETKKPKEKHKQHQVSENKVNKKSETIVAKEIEKGDDNKIIDNSKKNLKIVKVTVTTEIEGKYGTYIKTNGYVYTKDIKYSSKDIVQQEKTKIINEYNTKITDIKAKIEELNKQLKENQELGAKDIEKLTEIELVFDMKEN